MIRSHREVRMKIKDQEKERGGMEQTVVEREWWSSCLEGRILLATFLRMSFTSCTALGTSPLGPSVLRGGKEREERRQTEFGEGDPDGGTRPVGDGRFPHLKGRRAPTRNQHHWMFRPPSLAHLLGHLLPRP
jgi:hypothetical protein